MSVGAINKQTGDRIPTAGMPAIDDALDLTSVNPVQNAIVTAALALKQNATDNSLQTTDKTVVGAVNELKSGLTNLTNDVKLNTQDLTTPSRTKNVLPMTLAGIKSLNTTGTWNNNVYTENGVDFAVNTDTNGNVINITVNGTSSGVIYFYVADNLNYLGTFNGKYTVNGGVSGGRANTYALQVYSETNSILINCYESKDYIIEHTTYSNSAITSAVIVVRSGVTVENLVFTPMIRLSTETDPTFAPYIPSVETRLEAVESNLIKTKEVTVSVGTSQYDGYYYGTNTHDITGTIISAYIKGTGSNHAAFLNYCNDTTIRVCSPVADLNATVRIAYI